MKPCVAPLVLAVAVALLASSVHAQEAKPLFDGETLDGWKAPDMGFWSVEDGAIVARCTEDKPCPKNQFLVWQGGQPGDFVLELEFRIHGDNKKANSGIQIRSEIGEDGHAVGYQCDISRSEGPWLGTLYDEHTGRKVLAQRGTNGVGKPGGIVENERFATADEALPEGFDWDGWHTYRIEAVGNSFTLSIDGKVMSRFVDNDPEHFDSAGHVALQLHSGPPQTVWFRKIRLTGK